MYTVFTQDLIPFRSKNIVAQPISDVSLIESEWWSDNQITPPKYDIEFSITKKPPLPDNLLTSSIFDLYSSRLVRIFNEYGVISEKIPVILVDKSSKLVISQDYSMFHVLEMYSCVDLDKSREGYIHLREDFNGRGRPLFRISEAIQILLIRDDIRNKIISDKITGCRFYRLDEFKRLIN